MSIAILTDVQDRVPILLSVDVIDVDLVMVLLVKVA